MLLCSNNTFRCLGITVLAICLLTAWPISLCAEDSQAKKVLVLNSYHHALSRIYFANEKSPKKIIPDYVETVDFAFTVGLNIKRIKDHILECVYQQHKSTKVKFDGVVESPIYCVAAVFQKLGIDCRCKAYAYSKRACTELKRIKINKITKQLTSEP